MVIPEKTTAEEELLLLFSYTHIRFYIRNIPFSNVYYKRIYTNPSVVVGSKIIFLAVKEQYNTRI